MAKENVFSKLREIEESKKAIIDDAVSDVQKRLQGIADDVKMLGLPNFLQNPAFEQSLNELGLNIGVKEKSKKVAAAALPPVKETPIGLAIATAIKKHEKPMNVADLVMALGDMAKKPTIATYAARLVDEGVLYRPSRGLFAIK